MIVEYPSHCVGERRGSLVTCESNGREIGARLVAQNLHLRLRLRIPGARAR